MTRRPDRAGPPGPGSGASAAGRAGLIAIGVSVVCTFAVAVAGQSVMEPALPGRPGQPPWSLGLHPSGYLVVPLTAAGLAAGTLGLVLALRAVRAGWPFPARAVLLAGLLAATALTLVPPFGSSDHLSYAAYGRMLVTGHNPYTTTPAQLAALGDPIARAVQDWRTTPSVYGPLATAIQALASLAGGTSVRLTVFVLGLANLAAFAVTALLLHRMTRGCPARQLRAALLWAANPLLLQVLVAGAHVDSQAVVFGVAAVAVMFGPWPGRAGGHAGQAAPRTEGPKGPRGQAAPRTGGPRRHGGRAAPRTGGVWGGRPPEASRAAIAGVLVGLGFAVKVTVALIGLGLAVGLVLLLGRQWRRLVPPLLALGAGFAVIAGAAVAIGGSAMLRDSSQASDMVSIGSPWRVIRSVLDLGLSDKAGTDIVKYGAVVLAVVLAVLLIRGLPGLWPGRDAAAGDLAAGDLGAGGPGGRRAGGNLPDAGGPGDLSAFPGVTAPRIAGKAGFSLAGVAFALVLAWLFAWPYVLPWYDALGWALLPLLPMVSGPVAETVVWLLLARTAALGFGYLPARASDAPMPAGLTWLQPVIRHGVTPAVLAVATVWLVVLMVRSGRRPRSGPRGPRDPGAADSRTTATKAA